MKKTLYILVLIILIAHGCSVSKDVPGSPELNLSSLYNPSKLSLHPDFTVYHVNDQFSTLYIRAYPSEFRFSQANEETEYRASFRLSYKIIQLAGQHMEGVQVDSASVIYRMNEIDRGRTAFLASLNIPVTSGNKYLMDIQTQDLHRGSIGRDFIFIDKSNPFSAQNFKVISKHTGYPKFMNFFNAGEPFFIQFNNPQYDTILIQYFSTESELPRPPITATSDYTMQYSPDTTFMLPLSDTIDYYLFKKGMYFISVDRELKSGLTLHNFGSNFPAITSESEMLEPIFYLATLAEYRDLRKEPNRKLAVDNFWLKRGNSVEKSRELIRVYYNRVLYSNLYFTSNKEGWKTDMGMIFILFGPPNRIHMAGGTERWYYYSRGRGKTVEFVFERQKNKYTNDHFVWKKTTETINYWYEAVRSWRNGKVYNPGS
ncbi:MAG TPA: GWxTD domain-containing protein [Bacteroidaceae bacterium]|nr:GWxTD domain-containing protein [Bacteroidaceae bacterium]